jgi:hypothetical protein
MPFQDATVSNTTTRNTSRFVLLSKKTYNGASVNFQPALRSVEASRGGAFYITTADPIALHGSGESTI